MQFPILRLFVPVLFVACACLPVSGQTFDVGDHPDAFHADPPYGLRFDGLFSGFDGAAGGVTSFSATDLTLSVTDNAGNIEISITGIVRGGEDTGDSYGFGEGDYRLEFTFLAGVVEADGGWMTATPSAANLGTLTALGTYDSVTEGTVFDLYEKVEHGMPMEFKPDGHRISGDTTTWVLRGWLTDQSNGGDPGSGFQDFILTAMPQPPLPEPSSLVLCAGGIALTLARRRS